MIGMAQVLFIEESWKQDRDNLFLNLLSKMFLGQQQAKEYKLGIEKRGTLVDWVRGPMTCLW
jgi:hypothetical protein